MRFTLHDEIDFPRELVFTTIRDRLPDILPYLPNVDEIEVLESHDDGEIRRCVKRWAGSSDEIPAVVRPLIRPDILQWIDHATWDQGRWQVDWWHEMGVLPGAISAKGTNRFEADGDITIISMEGDFTIHPERLTFVPQIVARRAAPALERFIIGRVKPNLRATNEAVAAFLEDEGY